jgi:hypothetical protein
MTNKPQPHGIDALLRKWADDHTPDHKHMAALQSRIAGKVAMTHPSSAELHETSTPASTTSRGIWRSLASAAAGAAVCLLTLLAIDRFATDQVRETRSDQPETAIISHCRIEAGVTLFEEMNRLFNGNLRWVAESNGDMGIGVGEDREHLDSPPALVRLTMLARQAGTAEWSKVWQSDVMVREQDLVEVSPGHSSDAISLWVFPLEDGQISVDTTVALNTPIRIRAQQSTVSTPGIPIQVASLTENGKEYRVYQTVVLLDQTGGGA